MKLQLSNTGQLLASDQAHYQVQADLRQLLTGTVQAQYPELEQGQLQTCIDTVINTGLIDLIAQPIRQLLINLDTAEIISSDDINVDLIRNSPTSLSREILTGDLPEGNYACVLQANIDTEWLTLANDSFILIVPPIRIDNVFNAGTYGRVLVLIDDASLCSGNNSNGNGNGNCASEPPLPEQQASLETLLSEAGWSYTLVTDADSFTEEFQTGGYVTYLLLSEQVKLSETVQKQLREAIYRGEGLVEAGSHDQRQGRIDDALGINFRGKHPNMHGVSLIDSLVSPAGDADFNQDDKVLRADLNGAQTIGNYRQNGQTTTEIAVTINNYGAGRSLYAGFDLLAEVTTEDNQALYSQLILDALSHVHPDTLSPLVGSAYPVKLSLTNQGIATPGQVTLTLPIDTHIVDAGGAEALDNRLIWPFDLLEAQTLHFESWLTLPNDSLTLQADIETGIEPDFQAYDSLSLNIEPEATTTIGDILLSLQALNTNTYKKVKKEIDKAQQAEQQGDYAQALTALLRASDELIKINSPESNQLRIQVGLALRSLAALIQ